jgi:putative ABC transport system permease protein
MTTKPPQPPVLAEWLLRLVSAKADYPHVSGDLHEEFAAWALPTLGRRGAQRWYWQQVLLSVRPALSDGVRAVLDVKPLVSGVGSDITRALRMLRQSPATALVLLATLALGIGANTAMFSVANALLLRPLPFPNPERLFLISAVIGEDKSRLSVREIRDLNERTRAFTAVAGYAHTSYNFNGNGGAPENFVVTRTTHQLFDVLGVEPFLGSPWLAINDRSRSFLIALTHELWVRRFQSDPNIVGRRVQMDGYPNEVALVLPPGFSFPGREQVYRTWGIDADAQTYEQRSRREVLAVARLKPDFTREQAETDLAAISQQLAADAPDTNSGVRFVMEPLRDTYVGQVRPYLILLMLAVGVVLLMACVNVTNLLLARATGRDREMAVRAALGAGRLRLIRQSLIESLVLSLIGGGVGIAVAHWGTLAVTRLVRAQLPPWMDFRTDVSVLAFLLIISIATAVLAGLLPALKLAGNRLVDRLKEGARGSQASSRVRNGLVVAQVAFALVLLVGAGLLIQSFQRLQSVQLGFTPERLLTFHIGLSWNKYGLEEARDFQRAVLAELRQLPGVEDAFLNTHLPLTGRSSVVPIVLPGQTTENERRHNPLVSFQQVSVNYHRGLGVRLISGRFFDQRDHERAARVAVVSESLATRLWPDRDAIGQQLRPDPHSFWDREWVTVIGVVGNVKRDNPAGVDGLDLYVPFEQAGLQSADFLIRTFGNPMLLAPAVARAVAAVDPEEPVSHLLTMEQIVANTVWQRSLATRLFTVFGALALVLACAGIYGVIAYTVGQRQREIGIRGALGAQQRDVLGLVLSDGLALIIPGIALGLAASLVGVRVMAHLLFEAGIADVAAVFGATLVLFVAGILACVIPAHRAASLDPLVALRHE